MKKLTVIVSYYPSNVRNMLQDFLKEKGIEADIEDWDENRTDQEAQTVFLIKNKKFNEAKKQSKNGEKAEAIKSLFGKKIFKSRSRIRAAFFIYIFKLRELR